MRVDRRLRAWVWLRGPLSVLIAVLCGPAVFGAVSGWLVTTGGETGQTHSWAKDVLAVIHMLLRRQLWLPWVMVPLAVGAAVMALVPARWGVVVGGALAALLLIPALGAQPLPAVVFAAYLLSNGVAARFSSEGAARRFAWIPGSAALLPGLVARAASVPVAPAMIAVFSMWGLVWFAADSGLRARVNPQEIRVWPNRLVDPRVRTVAVADPKIRCEFHGIDVSADRVVITAEESTRLLSWGTDLVGAPTVVEQPRWWMPNAGLAMDSVTVDDTSFYLCGAHRMCTADWAAGGQVTEHAGFARPLDHVYSRRIDDTLALFTVNVRASKAPAMVSLMSLPERKAQRQVVITSSDGTPLPTVREVEWVASLHRFVLAPDFGDQLYLVDPQTWKAEPWLSVPSLNGKLRYDAILDRLYVAQPNRPVVLEIEPRTSAVREIPTQMGVRPVAVDAELGLLITASVLTGQVWVQALETGAVLDRFGTVMPMVRELALLPGRRAVLTTWTAVYEIPY